jgi:hypothetical protein
VPHDREPATISELKAKPGEPPPRPVMLTKHGAEILARLEHMMDDATRAMGPPPPPSASADKKKKKKDEAAIPGTGDALAATLEGRAFGRN